MTSLLDIGPLTEEISVGGKTVSVHGVTPEGFFLLLEKFPDLRTVFGGGKVEAAALIATAPQAVAYALAVSTTDRSEFSVAANWRMAIDKAAAVAVNLPAHYQIMLFQAALRLTFPDGVGPFMKAVEALADSINRVSGAAPVTTSSKRSRSGFTTDSVGMRLGQAAQSANSTH